MKDTKAEKDPWSRFVARLYADPGNYAYATARVKAKRSKLIPKDMYPKLLMMDLPQVTQYIMDTGYRHEIDELSGKWSGADLVEYALNRNLATSFRGLLKITKGMLHDNIERYLARYDVNNIKTVMRGNMFNARPSDIMESIVPAGSLDQLFFAELAQLETVEETVAALDPTPYGPVLERLIPDFRENRRLAPLETALERHFYGELLEATGTGREADELFSRFIRYRMDHENLKNLFRMKARTMDAGRIEPYLLDGGEQTTPRMLKAALAAKDMDELLDACRRLSYYAKLKEAVEVWRRERSLKSISDELDRIFLDISSDFSYRYPLSILPIMDFMIRKEREVRNLRAIARGKHEGLTHNEIETMLLI